MSDNSFAVTPDGVVDVLCEVGDLPSNEGARVALGHMLGHALQESHIT